MIDPSGRVSFNQRSYEQNCKGKCADYNPWPILHEAKRLAEKPACRAWWAQKFPNVPSLTAILDASEPDVFFEKLGGVSAQIKNSSSPNGTYDIWGTICLDCPLATGRYPRGGAATLVHEVIHFAQVQRGGWLQHWFNSTEAYVEGEATAGEEACLY
jgi:hypothetical protein